MEKLKFPAALVFGTAILVPTAEYLLTGGFSAITKITVAVDAVAVVGLVVVAVYNSLTKK